MTDKTMASKKKLSRAGTAVAVASVLLWAVFAAVLLTRAGTDDERLWSHMTWIFSSVQSIAFAAAGALFGTAVQQGRVDDAERRAADSKTDADNGRALATILQHDAPTAGTAMPEIAGGVGLTRGVDVSSPVEDVRQRYADLARSLFGDLTRQQP
ncbi:hypothetical protein ORI20_12945 [Mycobacterium sp. CVI_P3]|uniref:Uncharacterized protein n=1 Tax=Mycobacterium pinniadriaticum TaxID=2994102 RepID=A0ABT3SDK6_9MYCO|nr:hypothetical protein [Mycobacterium pinniadriaticum]MCX2931190.1 hypothetical protein [Mycobacterium pinniadriaticum]MCX2937586.1 hypothetical protein [Mycobacterium pinniadriaticum]